MKQLLICCFYCFFMDHVENSNVFIATSFLSHQGFFTYHLFTLTLTLLAQLGLLPLHILILETCCKHLNMFIYLINRLAGNTCHIPFTLDSLTFHSFCFLKICSIFIVIIYHVILVTEKVNILKEWIEFKYKKFYYF